MVKEEGAMMASEGLFLDSPQNARCSDHWGLGREVQSRGHDAAGEQQATSIKVRRKAELVVKHMSMSKQSGRA